MKTKAVSYKDQQKCKSLTEFIDPDPEIDPLTNNPISNIVDSE